MTQYRMNMIFLLIIDELNFDLFMYWLLVDLTIIRFPFEYHLSCIGSIKTSVTRCYYVLHYDYTDNLHTTQIIIFDKGWNVLNFWAHIFSWSIQSSRLIVKALTFQALGCSFRPRSTYFSLSILMLSLVIT